MHKKNVKKFRNASQNIMRIKYITYYKYIFITMLFTVIFNGQPGIMYIYIYI